MDWREESNIEILALTVLSFPIVGTVLIFERGAKTEAQSE